jgi:hypothetical protein
VPARGRADRVAERRQPRRVQPPSLPVQRDVDQVGRQPNEPARGQVGARLRLRQHGPAKPGADGLVEVGVGGDLVDDRRQRDAIAAQLLVLKFVFLAEDDDRHRRPVGQLPAPPPAGELWSRGGHVAQRSERLDRTALHGRRVAGDRGEHVTAAQQFL